VDFSLSEEQLAVAEAASKLFGGYLTDERRAAVDASGDGFDRALWSALADANLLGLAVPEAMSGAGLGFGEVAVLLEEAGRAAAPVPLWPAVVLGGLAVDRFGSDGLRERLLPSLASGDLVLSAALIEPGGSPDAPSTSARPAPGGGWVIDGAKTCVPAGTVAGTVLVPARTGDGSVAVFAVDVAAPGVNVTRLDTTTGIPEAHLDLHEVEVSAGDLLGGAASDVVLAWLLERAWAGLCSLAAGTCQAALDMTAQYAVTRTQFDRAIATFQAVGQRAADAYIDTEAIWLTSRQAAWRLAEGLPAAEQVAIAKYWASEGGQRVVHAAQHIHGGVGVDRTYPLHRYFLAAKQLELTLGGTTASLLRLGAIMAEQPRQG
jgi:alkylation response protein AidB-like acyl-CoA dehydrogenase